ncbi:transcriptional regulator [Diplodia seriata]
MDDYRFGGQSGVGQLSGATQQQQQVNIEEFPPLGGGGGGDLGQDRRTGMIQNAAYGGGSPFGNNVHQGRNGMVSPVESQQDSVSERIGGTVLRDDRTAAERRAREASTTSFGSQPVQPPSKSGSISHVEQTRLSQMSEIDRFGLPGLLAMIPPDSQDHSSLAVGQDLTVLGLDLNRPDNSPLYPTFGSPFAEAGSRPVIPDFSLPAAYTVTNVPPLHTKMPSFSDETLFAIFYQYPRDILQEAAAQELFNRDWRWHKELRQWMMKDNTFPQPQRISEKSERGCYIFFDVNNWRRERVSNPLIP